MTDFGKILKHEKDVIVRAENVHTRRLVANQPKAIEILNGAVAECRKLGFEIGARIMVLKETPHEAMAKVTLFPIDEQRWQKDYNPENQAKASGASADLAAAE